MQPLTKRQREILDYLNEFIQQHGYAPSLEEIGERFSLSSLATVHKHLTNLQEKGFIRRAWNRSRSVELLPSRSGGRAIELPMLGYVAAGMPIEAVAGNEMISVPDSLVTGKRDTYVLRVRGESMIDEQIRDGDWVVVEDRKTADNGEMVIALVDGQDVTLKKFYKETNRIRLQPANPAMQPIYVDPDLPPDPGRRRGRDAQILRCQQVCRRRRPHMTDRKQINFTIVPEDGGTEPRTYANFCAVNHTPFDFTLTFCEVMPLSEKEIREASPTMSCARRFARGSCCPCSSCRR